MKISGHTDAQSLKAYDCTDIEDLRSIAEKYTPKFDATPTPPKPVPVNEVEEMKKVIQQLLEENQKLKEKKDQNNMYG